MASLSGDDFMSEPRARTAIEAIADIRTTFRQLLGSSGFDVLPPSTNSSTTQLTNSKEATLHPLSSVCLPQSHRSLKSSIEILRGAVNGRESWDDESSQRFSRIKLDTIGKARAVKLSTSALSECRRLALTEDPFATRVMLAIHRLRAVAEQAGAMTTEESTNEDGKTDIELTVCRKKFVADFKFTDVCGHDIQVQVKFRLLNADDMGVTDPAIATSFKQLICDEDFDALKKAFVNLVDMEKLNEDTTGASLIDSLRCVEDDLLSIQTVESNLENEEEQRMAFGHGLITRTALGLEIKFMQGYSALLGIEASSSPRNIALDRSSPTQENTISDSTFPTFQFKESTNSTTVPTQYVLKFNQPVIMSLPVAQSLARISGASISTKPANRKQSGISSTNNYREIQSSRSDPRGDDAADTPQGWPSLQRMLAPLVFDHSSKHDSESAAKPDDRTYNVKPTIKQLSHWSQESTEFISAVALPENHYLEFSHSGSEVIPSVIIQRVCFCHPREVKPILGIVRQQVVFNELFKSCFEQPITVTSSLTSLQSQPIEVVVCDAPAFMQFSLYNQTIEDMLSMGVSVNVGGEITVTLKTSEMRYQGCSDAKATAILRVCRSIPLTIFTIAKMEASYGAPQA